MCTSANKIALATVAVALWLFNGGIVLADCTADVSPSTDQTVTDSPAHPTTLTVTYTYTNNGGSDTNWAVAEVDVGGNPTNYDWLSVAPTSGGPIPPAGNSGDIVATIDGTGKIAGTYTAYLQFTDENCTGVSAITRKIIYKVVPQIDAGAHFTSNTLGNLNNQGAGGSTYGGPGWGAGNA